MVGRCLRDNRGLSQSLKEGDNTCRLQSKSPFTVGMECVTKAVMQLSVCMFVLLPTLNATLCICLGCSGNTDLCLGQLCRNLSDCTAHLRGRNALVCLTFNRIFLSHCLVRVKTENIEALISAKGTCLQGGGALSPNAC